MAAMVSMVSVGTDDRRGGAVGRAPVRLALAALLAGALAGAAPGCAGPQRFSAEDRDSVVAVLERRPDGWRIIHDHTSSDPK